MREVHRWVTKCRLRVRGRGLQVQRSAFSVHDSVRVQGAGFRVQGSGFRVQG